MPKVEIQEERCKSCSLCIEICPKKVLRIGKKVNAKGYYFVEAAKPEQCIGCALCGTMCPDVAIHVYK
ncbi:MAG: 2-oxoglutarate-acceptor oxidoreductase subunit OorD [Firmicutes bacterium]|nr:2-oxoglutarate-acceptor oxidoreductase subunit OorD [Bacillota bacterium]